VVRDKMDSIPNSEAKRPLCCTSNSGQEGIHAMSRNSSENRSSNKQREIALPLPNRAPQLRTAQGIDEACKTVLQQPD